MLRIRESLATIIRFPLATRRTNAGAAACRPRDFGIDIETTWVAYRIVWSNRGYEKSAGGFIERLFASPGSPYRSFEGMLRGIEFARTRNWPFVGNLRRVSQHTLVEYARNVLGIADADFWANTTPVSKNIVITPVSCAVAESHAQCSEVCPGRGFRSGLKKGSLLRSDL